MQKKMILTISAIALSFLVLPTFIDMLISFLFLGIIPGTDTTIPFWVMLPVSVFGGLFLLHWIGNQPIFIGSLEFQDKMARELARKNVAKKVARHRAQLAAEQAPAPPSPAPKKRYHPVRSTR